MNIWLTRLDPNPMLKIGWLVDGFSIFESKKFPKKTDQKVTHFHELSGTGKYPNPYLKVTLILILKLP